MGSEMGRSKKSYTTLTAMVQSLFKVCSLVDLQGFCVPKSLLTLGALVVSFFRVDSSMEAQISGRNKILLTLITAVGLFACMNAFMNLNMLPMLECLSTMTAFVWRVT